MRFMKLKMAVGQASFALIRQFFSLTSISVIFSYIQLILKPKLLNYSVSISYIVYRATQVRLQQYSYNVDAPTL